MTVPRFHRWSAIVLVVLLVVWSITGLLFHIKPGWSRAYDQLAVERPARLALADVQPLAALAVNDATRVELFDSAIGPLYRVTTATGTRLVDARTAQVRSPLSEADARTLALDAVARSPFAGEYGAVTSASASEATVSLAFSGGPLVEVGRDDGRISQHGGDTDRIDWLYRIHYLQWTGNRVVDRVLALAGLALIWAVMIPGVVLFIRRRPNAGTGRSLH
jgi:hypothetical protein